MREEVKSFAQIVVDTLPIVEPIYEFGALQVPGQEGYADLRPLFTGRQYTGCDMREGLGVDRVLDLHNIELSSESVGTVLIMDTLEHVEFPHRALSEAHRILVPGGMVAISSVMAFGIHEYPADYWRFTPEGFRSLLGVFSSSYVASAGVPHFPHTVVGVGLKGLSGISPGFIDRIKAWEKQWTG